MIDQAFLVCAIVGGGVFVVRTLLQLLGVGGDDAGMHDGMHDGGDDGFRILSLQGLSAFLMMFGLVGLALVRESHVGAAPATGLAALAGAGSMWLIGRVFGAMGRLQSSGTMDLNKAVGQVGTIYLSVQRGGRGKVEVIVQNRLSVFDARASDGGELPTGKRVRVVDVEGDVMVVEAVEAPALSAATEGGT